jgi:hypothetical protein
MAMVAPAAAADKEAMRCVCRRHCGLASVERFCRGHVTTIEPATFIVERFGALFERQVRICAKSRRSARWSPGATSGSGRSQPKPGCEPRARNKCGRRIDREVSVTEGTTP